MWLDTRPTNADCAVLCGASIKPFDVRKIRDTSILSEIKIYSKTNNAPSVSPSTSNDGQAGIGEGVTTTPSPSMPASPSISPSLFFSASPSVSPAPTVGAPRIIDEEDLPMLNRSVSPDENRQRTSLTLETFVYPVLRNVVPFALIRTTSSIEQNPFGGIQISADTSTRFLLVTSRTLTTQCSSARCSTRVRVWSNVPFPKHVIFRAVAKLRRQPSFKEVYTIYWTKIKRTPVPKNNRRSRLWIVDIPFKISYQRRFINNEDF